MMRELGIDPRVIHKPILTLTEAVDALTLSVGEMRACKEPHDSIENAAAKLEWLSARLEDEQKAQAEWEQTVEVHFA
jgi:hypothetical protein